jgi:thiol-disulfide isomerase/thioredoxin
MTVLAARVVLVAVFAVAGIAKLTDRRSVRATTVAFGAPPRLAGLLAWGLIGSELGVAAALAFGPSARVGAVAALVLLLVFGAAVAINVSRGRHPECRCFGRLHSSEIGWSTVARNGLLAALAGLVAADGGLPLLWAAVAGIASAAWLLLELRTPGELRRGVPAPALTLADQEGRDRTLESLFVGTRPLLLVFGDPDCDACRELLPLLADWQTRLEAQLTVAVVSGAGVRDNDALGDEFGLQAVFADPERGAAIAYGITATPSAVLVDAAQRIAADPAVGADEIARLVAGATGSGPDLAVARRALLVRAAMGVAAVTVAPLASAAAAAARSLARPKKLKLNGAWLCDQRYALCTFAACKPSKTNKDVSICRCKIKTGYSVGFKNCDRRAPRGRQLHSNFSLQDVTARTRVLKCSERGLWVQCLDVVCEVDRHDPKHASCQCVNQRTKNFYTFGGACKVDTCQSVIWSATTAPFPGGAQYEAGLKKLGVPFRSPKSCPTPK